MSAPRLLLISPRAAADLEEIAEYVAHDYRDFPDDGTVRIKRVLQGARHVRRLL